MKKQWTLEYRIIIPIDADTYQHAMKIGNAMLPTWYATSIENVQIRDANGAWRVATYNDFQ